VPVEMHTYTYVHMYVLCFPVLLQRDVIDWQIFSEEFLGFLELTVKFKDDDSLSSIKEIAVNPLCDCFIQVWQIPGFHFLITYLWEARASSICMTILIIFGKLKFVTVFSWCHWTEWQKKRIVLGIQIFNSSTT
jgi:hypothetical protein